MKPVTVAIRPAATESATPSVAPKVKNAPIVPRISVAATSAPASSILCFVLDTALAYLLHAVDMASQAEAAAGRTPSAPPNCDQYFSNASMAEPWLLEVTPLALLLASPLASRMASARLCQSEAAEFRAFSLAAGQGMCSERRSGPTLKPPPPLPPLPPWPDKNPGGAPDITASPAASRASC